MKKTHIPSDVCFSQLFQHVSEIIFKRLPKIKKKRERTLNEIDKIFLHEPAALDLMIPKIEFS